MFNFTLVRVSSQELNTHLKILKYLYRNQQDDWTDVTNAFSKKQLEKYSKRIDRSISQLQRKKYIVTPAGIFILEDTSTWSDPNIREAQITLDGIDYYESKTVKVFNSRITKLQLGLSVVAIIGLTSLINWSGDILSFIRALFDN